MGNKDEAKKDWVFTNSKGESKTFRSEIEARAAQVRDQGRGSIK
jgi:hypothetical protein